jgi:putative phosphoserine phosphatase/1-acylglycerol-3-phosphate O-acyltransferase
MNKKKTFDYIAFYDLDHTILKVNSATHLVNEARKREIMSGKKFRHAIWLSIRYKLRIGNSTKMIIRMLSWLRGLREDDIDKLCKDVFSKHLVDNIRPEIIETIQEHRSKKGGVVLLSSASEPICRQFQVYLNMDDLICSKLESVEGILTGKTQGNLVYAREKESRLAQYCNIHGYSQAEAYYYGDSFTDEFVMNAVGFPIAVDPDKKLLRIALKNKWPIIARNRA